MTRSVLVSDADELKRRSWRMARQWRWRGVTQHEDQRTNLGYRTCFRFITAWAHTSSSGSTTSFLASAVRPSISTLAMHRLACMPGALVMAVKLGTDHPPSRWRADIVLSMSASRGECRFWGSEGRSRGAWAPAGAVYERALARPLFVRHAELQGTAAQGRCYGAQRLWWLAWCSRHRRRCWLSS